MDNNLIMGNKKREKFKKMLGILKICLDEIQALGDDLQSDIKSPEFLVFLVDLKMMNVKLKGFDNYISDETKKEIKKLFECL